MKRKKRVSMLLYEAARDEIEFVYRSHRLGISKLQILRSNEELVECKNLNTGTILSLSPSVEIEVDCI